MAIYDESLRGIAGPKMKFEDLTPALHLAPFGSQEGDHVQSAGADLPSRFELGHQAVASRRGHGSVDMQRGEIGKVIVVPVRVTITTANL